MKMKERNFDVIIHYMMAVFGGFIGVYGIVNRLDVFGSAQTGNLISLMGDLIGKNMGDVCIRVGAFLIYIASIVLATILERKIVWNLKYAAIAMDVVGIILLGFFPVNMDPVIALYPIFFLSAFQWCVFKGAKGYVSSTIFSTNNLKQTFSAWTEYYLIDKSQKEERKEKTTKAKFFGGTVISFYIGVLLGYLCSTFAGVECIWFCIPILAIVLGLLLLDDNIIKIHEQKQVEPI